MAGSRGHECEGSWGRFTGNHQADYQDCKPPNLPFARNVKVNDVTLVILHVADLSKRDKLNASPRVRWKYSNACDEPKMRVKVKNGVSGIRTWRSFRTGRRRRLKINQPVIPSAVYVTAGRSSTPKWKNYDMTMISLKYFILLH